jgi:uncharacterized protein (UPF0548 family)
VFLLGRPTAEQIRRFLARQQTSSLSYHPVGLSRLSPPGYDVDHQRVRIGSGPETFARARAALDAWAMFRLGWVELHPERPPTKPGTNVAVVARHFGLWSVNGCRIVETIPGDDRHHGFCYGTLQDHGESGEELFAVELDAVDASVWYEIRAVSRPRAPLARLGYPVTRWLQRQFRVDSAKAMTAAVNA